MSLYTDWSAARARLITHITAAWAPAVLAQNGYEVFPVAADLPFARIRTVGGADIQGGYTPTLDQASVVFEITGLWAKQSSTDAEDWLMQKAEDLRDDIASDHHLNGNVTDCTVTSFELSSPDLDPQDDRWGVTLQVSCTIHYSR